MSDSGGVEIEKIKCNQKCSRFNDKCCFFCEYGFISNKINSWGFYVIECEFDDTRCSGCDDLADIYILPYKYKT